MTATTVKLSRYHS